MDSGKTFNMLHCKTLHEKRTSIGLNVSAATLVKETPNILLKKKTQKPKPNKKATLNPHPNPNKTQKNNPPKQTPTLPNPNNKKTQKKKNQQKQPPKRTKKSRR